MSKVFCVKLLSGCCTRSANTELGHAGSTEQKEHVQRTGVFDERADECIRSATNKCERESG